MDIQVVLPDESTAMTPETLIALGVMAEQLGFHTAWLPDHLLPPEDYGDTYGGVYEPLITLAYLAARTSAIRLGTSVLVVPMRNPFVLAKQVATLDRLSGGRLTLGVGIGWNTTEFTAVGADFRTRGARTDEAIALLRHLFGNAGPFDGRFHQFGAGVFAPQPLRDVPITVGGTSDRALQRVATLADEWQGLGLSPAEFAAKVADIRSRTDRPIRVGTRIEWRGDPAALERAVAEAHGFAAAGADALAVWFGPVEGTADRMTQFMAAVTAR